MGRRKSTLFFWRRVAVCVHGHGCAACCWLWLGATNQAGYGRLRYRFAPWDTETYAHRVAWRYATGRPFPVGTEACHTCDNHGCCNPEHIRADTHAVNMAERGHRSPHTYARGEQSGKAKLTTADIEQIWYRHIILRETQRMIAAGIGVSQVAIGAVLSRKTWKHVPIPHFTDSSPLLL